MEKRPRHEVDRLGRHLSIHLVPAVPQNQTRPVFARVSLLDLVVHLYCFSGPVIVLHAHYGKFVITQRKQLFRVGSKQKIAVTKKRPAFVLVERGDEKSCEAELGTKGLGISCVVSL